MTGTGNPENAATKRDEELVAALFPPWIDRRAVLTELRRLREQDRIDAAASLPVSSVGAEK